MQASSSTSSLVSAGSSSVSSAAARRWGSSVSSVDSGLGGSTSGRRAPRANLPEWEWRVNRLLQIENHPSRRVPGPEASGRAEEEESRNFYLESLKFGALIQEERIGGAGQLLELLDAGGPQEPGDKMARYREMRSRNRKLTDRAGGRGRPAAAPGLGEDERSALEALEAALDEDDDVKSYYAEPLKGEEEGGTG